MYIDTNKAHDSISAKIMDRMGNLFTNVEGLMERIKKHSMQKSITSKDFKDLMQDCKETSSPLMDLLANARATVDLFCAGETSPQIAGPAPPSSEEESN